ncbi:adenylate/guanylate cyclase domain-containing protein [uncultured Pseudacidovorax sp.]|uniref:CHASE2 domain-containing protein n=1 Tax=uncultured Pseudacidovorax sp. TaxID=679313 RepID=UPI002600533F|nr:adenylate/guanylate cyclase domain-containing protein [uncultured Pseudacidovorax sp.]
MRRQRLLDTLRGHGWRIAITLLPILAGLAHTAGLMRWPGIGRLDVQIQDARLRLHAPGGIDPRIVIVDVDEASLRAVGQWPWRRDRLAQLTQELTQRQQASVVAFDMVFAEADRTGGAALLQALGPGRWPADPAFDAELARRAATIDPDAEFARALAQAPGRVVLGFHFDAGGAVTGAGPTDAAAAPTPAGSAAAPAPVLPPSALPAGAAAVPAWHGLTASLPGRPAGAADGFINVVFKAGQDGVIRSVPLLARLEGAGASGGYYPSLALATWRATTGSSTPLPSLAETPGGGLSLTALAFDGPGGELRVPVGPDSGIVVPYRRPAPGDAPAFAYLSARDVLEGKLPAGALQGRIVLVGASAAGLQDLRATPFVATMPGVEVHAHVISGLLDRRLLHVPDYAPGYEVASLLAMGLLMAVGAAWWSAPAALAAGLAGGGGLLLLNDLLFRHDGLVLPQATALLSGLAALLLNLVWGYFVESRRRRGLMRLFGAYVPPQLVDEMAREPHRYSMRAEGRVLTVMFCDMRGFTRLAEHMAPQDLQALLHEMFTQLTDLVIQHGGTVDKYMGDCLMAFWGAPVAQPDHAVRAVRAAQAIVAELPAINARHRRLGLPAVDIGIGLNSGPVVVGNMGSALRRSYTAIGDAVNLAARLEGLCATYGVPLVAGEATAALAPEAPWRPLAQVQVRGREQGVRIFTLCEPGERAGAADSAPASSTDAPTAGAGLPSSRSS